VLGRWQTRYGTRYFQKAGEVRLATHLLSGILRKIDPFYKRSQIQMVRDKSRFQPLFNVHTREFNRCGEFMHR